MTAHDVLSPIFSSGVLAAAPVWALAAVVLPWLVRGRSLPLDLVLVTIWAATTVSASDTVIALAHHGAGASDGAERDRRARSREGSWR